ncbi:MAG: GAF domain-containing protein [Deltaproteobacteria bacterium]|nr:GAF domain-containing protein [Deltaproteobacteria bacterium]
MRVLSYQLGAELAEELAPLCRSRGYRLEAVASPEAVVAALRGRDGPTVLLLNEWDEGADYPTLIQTLKSLPEGSRLTVVALLASDDPSALEPRARAALCDAIFPPHRAARVLFRLDLAEQRLSAARREAGLVDLVKLVAQVAERSSSLDEAARDCLARVGPIVGWPVGHLYMASEAGLLVSTHHWYLPEEARFAEFRQLTEATPFPPGTGLPGRVLESGQPVLTICLEEEAWFVRRDAARSVGLRSAAAFPISSHERTVGVLEFFHPERLEMNPGLREALVEVGKQLGRVVERDRAESRLARSEARLRALLSAVPDMIFRLKADGTVVDFSSSAGLEPLVPPEEFLGQRVSDVLPPEVAVRVTEAIRRAISRRESQTLEYRLATHGKTRYYEARLVATSPDEVVAIVRDVSELKRMHAQLFLADRLASVGTLAAGVAHEINNPLSYVIWNLGYLAESLTELAQWLPAERQKELDEALGEARQGAERMRQIVRDLRTFSRPDDQKDGPVDLHRLLESTVNMAHNELRHRAQVTKDFGAVPAVLGNESRLGQVFLNLLVNAAQAIPEGAADHNEVRIRTFTDATGHAVVEITDTGSGIAPELVGQLFDPFFTTKPVGVGTGLGLSICHGIVTSLGGEIQVESELGRGSTFRVVLPRGRPVAVPPSMGAEAPTPSKRGRVMVVDDEPLVGTAIRRSLSAEHDVVVLTRAREALDRILSGELYDLIICDLMMPEMTGMDLHAALADRAPGTLEKVVYLTGGAFTSRGRDFLDQVPNLRLDKPLNPKELRALVRERLGE